MGLDPARGESQRRYFKALQNVVVLFVRENVQRCIMYRRSTSTLARLRDNLEGHTNDVSSVCAQFTVTASVAAVIDQQVAMSPEPQGLNLVFPQVNMHLSPLLSPLVSPLLFQLLKKSTLLRPAVLSLVPDPH